MTLPIDDLLAEASDPQTFLPTQPDDNPAGVTPPSSSRFVVIEEPLVEPFLMRTHPTKVYGIVCEVVRTRFGDTIVQRSICVVDKSIVH